MSAEGSVYFQFFAYDPAPWTADALCTQVDDELFFPESDPEPAKSVCRGCPVKAACLEYALEHREFGVWGATTTHERVIIRRQRKEAA